MTDDFFEAIKQGDQQAVAQFLTEDPSYASAHTQSGLSAILLAIYYGATGIADMLIANDAVLDIFDACATGKSAIVLEWLTKQPELINAYNLDGFHPLGLAAFFGHADVVRLLLDMGADVNQASNNAQKVPPLISASARGSLEIARCLIDAGADVNARQINDFTAMHNAAQIGQIPMAELLLAHGAEVSPLSTDQRTPLDFAREQNHNDMVAYLIKQGAKG